MGKDTKRRSPVTGEPDIIFKDEWYHTRKDWTGQYIPIDVERGAFEVISTWASVGRTISTAIALLGNAYHDVKQDNYDQADLCIEELQELLSPLSNVNYMSQTKRRELGRKRK